MKINMIVAMGKNRQIGLDNQLLWRIKEDSKLFKERTMGHTLIMGRKTFESIGKPLPGRKTIVITTNDNWSFEGVTSASSPEEALIKAQEQGINEVFIAGGEQIYKQFLKLVDYLFLSRVDFDGPADTYFPEFENICEWSVLEKEEYPATNNSPSWTFQILAS